MINKARKILPLSSNIVMKVFVLFTLLFSLLASASAAEAASLSLSPSTGVYSVGSTFSSQVRVNTNGKPVNAADGVLSFNPNELSVVSVNRAGSIFNLWVTEPEFSNSAGTISFSGGVPSGFSGASGNVMSVTFRTKTSGATRVSFSSGSVLANDGRGTNILSNMSGGSYTVSTPTTAPAPEVIVEYVPPANTPSAPVITSTSHADKNGWYKNNNAELAWSFPSGITSVRTLLNESPNTIPTKVYDSNLPRNITLADLPEGESYFHIQFKNSDGWGKVAHYRLGVDTAKPSSIEITSPEGENFANPNQTLVINTADETTAVSRFMVKLDADEPYEVIDTTGSSTITLPPLEPGYHSVIIEAFDEAGNSIVGTYSFTIESFDRPIFTEYPNEISSEVIPVIKGQTRPNSVVNVELTKVGGEALKYTVEADESGVFTFIPEGRLTDGVYDLSAMATDSFGAVSERSEVVRIAVQERGYIRIGSFLISLLSVIVPLVALVALLGLLLWYVLFLRRRFRSRLRIESSEALSILKQEFFNLHDILNVQETTLRSSRKSGKLTKAEAEVMSAIDAALTESRQKVEKEITDITTLAKVRQKKTSKLDKKVTR